MRRTFYRPPGGQSLVIKWIRWDPIIMPMESLNTSAKTAAMTTFTIYMYLNLGDIEIIVA